MSTRGVVVRVEAGAALCPLCRGPTVVQKSTRRNVVTVKHGPFLAYETVRVCRARCRHPSGELVTTRSESLSRRVPPGAVYGYDVEVFVGLRRFVEHRQREEIRTEFSKEHGITLSSGEVSTLALRFIEHLAELHARRRPALREVLAGDGGYPLHFDATGEDGRGTLFVAYAGWREWVLGAWKLPTERADQITPHLREVAEGFGPPSALMRDLGRAARTAAKNFVSKLKVKIPVLGCHLHFLRDIGKDLLKEAHDKLRGLFRGAKVRPGLRILVRDLGRRLGTHLPALREEVIVWAEKAAEHVLPDGRAGLAAVRTLAQWVLDFARDGRHLGFPFERPYLDLYERARKARRAVDAFLRRPPPDKALCRALRRLARVLDPVVTDKRFCEVSKTLAARAELFDELRAALRLEPKPAANEKSDLSPQEVAAELRDIRKALRRLKRLLRKRRPARGPAKDSRKAIDLVLAHLKRHGSSLWGHVIKLPKKSGGGIRVVARTNNLLETFFHRMKRGERRRSGRKLLTQDFEHLPAEAALAYNLSRPDYVEIVCGSLEKLAGAFAEIDATKRAQVLATPPSERQATEKKPQADFASLPRADRRIVRAESLKERIEAAARSRAPRRAAALG